MTPLIVINNVEAKKIQKRPVSLKLEEKTMKIDFIVDLVFLTLILVTFLIVLI